MFFDKSPNPKSQAKLFGFELETHLEDPEYIRMMMKKNEENVGMIQQWMQKGGSAEEYTMMIKMLGAYIALTKVMQRVAAQHAKK